MKSIIKFIILITGLTLVSCGPPRTAIADQAETNASIANPTVIGKLPDGREIKCIIRSMDSEYEYPHYIYYIGDVVTTNVAVPEGKTTYNQVTVEIDGVKYVPLEK